MQIPDNNSTLMHGSSISNVACQASHPTMYSQPLPVDVIEVFKIFILMDWTFKYFSWDHALLFRFHRLVSGLVL